ncbi:MAG: hypothetical protein AAF690_21690 [Acidobacteriota bacterium]
MKRDVTERTTESGRETYPSLEVAAHAARLTERVLRSELRSEMTRQRISHKQMVLRTGLAPAEVEAVLLEGGGPLSLEQLYRAAHATGRTLMVSML